VGGYVAGWVYFMASPESAVERYLYRAPLLLDPAAAAAGGAGGERNGGVVVIEARCSPVTRG
jgi:hypothetical protein